MLAVFAMAALMWGAYAGREVGSPVLWASCVAAGRGRALGRLPAGGRARRPSTARFVSDGFARFAKVMILFGAAAALAMSHDYLERAGLMKFEYPVLIVLSAVGMMIMVSARDLIVLYMGLELQSLALYVVAAFRRDSPALDRGGAEVLRARGAVARACCSTARASTYGYAGTTGFAGIAETIGTGPLPLGLVFGLVFLCAGIAFKVSAVPFHMWTPDVYEGSPTPVTAFFATAPKVAAAAMFARAAVRRLRRRGGGLAADPGAALGRLDVPRRGRRDRPAQLQAADGLFLDQPHGLRADGAGRRHRSRGRSRC